MFAPTAVGQLLTQEELSAELHTGIVSGNAHRPETREDERSAIVETDAPDRFPGTVGQLGIGQITHAVTDGTVDPLPLHLRKLLPNQGEGGEDGAGALGKGVVDHDVGENVGAVENFDPFRPDHAIAATPATVLVLVAQNEIQTVADDFGRDRFGQERLGLNQGQQTLGSAVGNRPAVLPLAEGPAAFAGKSVVATGIG